MSLHCRQFSKKSMLLKQYFNLTTLSWVEQYTKFLSDNKLNLATLQHLVTCGVISKGMSEKIAKSALCYKHLKLAYERNGEDGIQAFFSEIFNGSVRITKSRKIISSVAQHFKS